MQTQHFLVFILLAIISFSTLIQADSIDILSYEIDLKIEPENETISGFVEVGFTAIISSEITSFDLVDSLVVSSVTTTRKESTDLLKHSFKQQNNKLTIEISTQAGHNYKIKINYAGLPTAYKPGRNGGFLWYKSDNGLPWIGVITEPIGSKIWIPAKLELGDEPNQVTMRLTVPKPLKAVSNGVLMDTNLSDTQWNTFTWETKHSINIYNITFYIGDFEEVNETYKGIPLTFFFQSELQQNDTVEGDQRSYQEKKNDLISDAKKYLDFFSSKFGPFPYSNEKFGIVHAPYYGMEHQTAIAYGAHFDRTKGYDPLLFHEMAHEWFGNSVTASAWKHIWIHEGIATYLEGLFLEEEFGDDEYLEFFSNMSKQNAASLLTSRPIVAPWVTQMEEAFGPVYNKGAWVLHTLRYVLNNRDQFIKILNKLSTDPQFLAPNFVGSQDFVDLVHKETGKNLSWFFDRYLYGATVPMLFVKSSESGLELKWDNNSLEIPVELELIDVLGNSKIIKVEMKNGLGSVNLNSEVNVKVDPKQWILMEVTPGRYKRGGLRWPLR